MNVNGWLIGLLALPTLCAAMIVRIWWRNRRTRHWRSAIGRIVESRSTSRDVRSRESHLVGRTDGGNATVVTNQRIERKNFAAIAYEYTVTGQLLSSRRVGPDATAATSTWWRCCSAIRRARWSRSTTIPPRPATASWSATIRGGCARRGSASPS